MFAPEEHVDWWRRLIERLARLYEMAPTGIIAKVFEDRQSPSVSYWLTHIATREKRKLFSDLLQEILKSNKHTTNIHHLHSKQRRVRRQSQVSMHARLPREEDLHSDLLLHSDSIGKVLSSKLKDIALIPRDMSLQLRRLQSNTYSPDDYCDPKHKQITVSDNHSTKLELKNKKIRSDLESDRNSPLVESKSIEPTEPRVRASSLPEDDGGPKRSVSERTNQVEQSMNKAEQSMNQVEQSMNQVEQSTNQVEVSEELSDINAESSHGTNTRAGTMQSLQATTTTTSSSSSSSSAGCGGSEYSYPALPAEFSHTTIPFDFVDRAEGDTDRTTVIEADLDILDLD